MDLYHHPPPLKPCTHIHVGRNTCSIEILRENRGLEGLVLFAFEFFKIILKKRVVIPDGAWEDSDSPPVYSLFPSSLAPSDSIHIAPLTLQSTLGDCVLQLVGWPCPHCSAGLDAKTLGD